MYKFMDNGLLWIDLMRLHFGIKQSMVKGDQYVQTTIKWAQRIKSSAIKCYVLGRAGPNIMKEFGVFILKAKIRSHTRRQGVYIWCIM